MRLHDFRDSETPFSQLSRPLSIAAESGQVGRDLGYLPARQRMISVRRPVSPASVLFVHPALGSHHPLPPRSAA